MSEVPVFDPAVHTDPDQVVQVRVYSTSGSVFAQRDPAGYVLSRLRSWVLGELRAGHRPASRADAIREAERRREAAHVAAGRGEDYTPSPKLDAVTAEDEIVIPWPEVS